MEYERFFAELTPRLDAARSMERDLDRKLAHRFNVFDFLRKNSEQERVPELRLSRIIAHLLDPRQTHGQDTLFLRAFLKAAGLNGYRDWPEVDGAGLFVKVKCEHSTPAGRSIDILVRIESEAGGEAYGLAFENKPYADDEENQVQDYLEYLREEFGDRFLFVYLSSNGAGPSEASLPIKELVKWKGRLAIMPYCWDGPRRADDFDGLRVGTSLADWLGECRKNCEAERLRCFLEEFKAICREIGGQSAMSDGEREAAVQFMLANPDNLKTAQAVYDSWSDILDRIGPTFLESLRVRIKATLNERETLKPFVHDMRVVCQYDARAYKSHLSMYRLSWTQYRVETEIDRTCIQLNNAGKGPCGWYIGVCAPMDRKEMEPEDNERQKSLENRLNDAFRESGGKSTDWWPWYSYVNADKRDWRQLVPNLYRESQGQGGELMTHFVEKFVEVTEKALPVIDGIERVR